MAIVTTLRGEFYSPDALKKSADLVLSKSTSCFNDHESILLTIINLKFPLTTEENAAKVNKIACREIFKKASEYDPDIYTPKKDKEYNGQIDDRKFDEDILEEVTDLYDKIIREVGQTITEKSQNHRTIATEEEKILVDL